MWRSASYTAYFASGEKKTGMTLPTTSIVPFSATVFLSGDVNVTAPAAASQDGQRVDGANRTLYPFGAVRWRTPVAESLRTTGAPHSSAAWMISFIALIAVAER